MRCNINLFILDSDLATNARYHVDKHVVKMPLEAAQLACTALHVVGGDAPYRKTHVNHPCAIWARATAANFEWPCRYGIALCREYSERYGRQHKCYDVLVGCIMQALLLPKGDLTQFVQAMPEKYQQSDAIAAYRSYYLGDKRHLANWSKREVPAWWE